jgi:predicted nucleic acid-binding Zn ribbon protein
MTRLYIRKNINCKECDTPNPKGKQFCSDTCAHINLLKRKKVEREATKHLKPLYNGISKTDEIEYYKD